MSQPTNPYDGPEHLQPRQGMSSSTKTLLGVGLGCGVLLLLCCGGFMIFGYKMAEGVKNATTDDPTKIKAITDEIVSLEIPASLEPKTGVDFKMPFVNQQMFMSTNYETMSGQSKLMLIQFGGKLVDKNAMEQMKQEMKKNNSEELEEVPLEESEDFETKINGETATFKIGKGKDASGKEIWQAIGPFQGKTGAAMLTFQGSTDEFTKDQMLDLLKSMK